MQHLYVYNQEGHDKHNLIVYAPALQGQFDQTLNILP